VLVLLAMLAGCDDGAPDDETNPVRAETIPRIVPASEVLAGAHIPTLDPAKLNDAEIRRALGPGSRCEFGYASYSRPILAMRASPNENRAAAVIKLNDKLVLLQREPGSKEVILRADEIRITLKLPGSRHTSPKATDRQDADLVFEARDQLRAGYRGYYRCRD
jgi:hypothetical protein